MFEFLWLLLPVAAASGWFAAKRSSSRSQEQKCSDLSSEYFEGLNYLLNEQPDKAIEVFIRMVEVDKDTVETHLALGSLFRRRGEVDRAIRIHQNLIARPTLTRDQKSQALLELGEDYMKAGLFDRAENLLLELIELKSHTPTALQHLIDIYQQEKDWDKAIRMSRMYESSTGQSMHRVIAQYYCEMAQTAIEEQNESQAESLIKQAFSQDGDCVRASILLGQLEQRNGNYKDAVKAYQRILDQDVEYLPEVIDEIQECYRKLDDEPRMQKFLDDILARYNGITPMLVKAEYLLEQQGEKEALAFMANQLQKRPSVRGLQWLVEQNLERTEGRARENLTILRDLIHLLLKDKPIYECNLCGFTGKTLHWQCPSCKQWNTVKPIKGVEAE
jgi:lipopolysaccharide biosynthesis regulator YciM